MRHEKIEPPEGGPCTVMSFTEIEVRALVKMARVASVHALGQVTTLPNREDDVRLEAALFYDEARKLETRFQRIAGRL